MSAADNNYLSYADADSAKGVVGLLSSTIWQRFLEEDAMHALLNWRIATQLSPILELRENEAPIINCICNLEISDLEHVSRIVSCLVQAPAILKIVDGKLLSEVVTFSGAEQIVDVINSEPLPIFRSIPKTTYITTKLLDYYATRLLSFTLGLVPDGYRQRYILKYPPGRLPNPKYLDDRPEDRNTLFYLLSIACQLIVKEHRRA